MENKLVLNFGSAILPETATKLAVEIHKLMNKIICEQVLDESKYNIIKDENGIIKEYNAIEENNFDMVRFDVTIDIISHDSRRDLTDKIKEDINNYGG